MGIRPDEFHLMKQEDFYLMRMGYADKRKVEESIARKQAALICEAFIGKGKGLEFVMKNWKIGNEVSDQEARFERLKKKLKKYREQEALKKHLNKNG